MARHPPNAAIDTPRVGAMIGAMPPAILTYDCCVRASCPENRSRTMARTSTCAGPAPIPMSRRQTGSVSMERAKVASPPKIVNTATPPSSMGRRPKRSDSGPKTRGPSAKPAMKTLKVSAALAGVTCSDSAVSASTGRPMSVANDACVTRAPSSSVNASECWCGRFTGLSGTRVDVHGDVAPPSLIEPQHAQCATRRVANENRDPDVERLECTSLLDHEADPQWHEHLRDDRDVEWALGVAGSLKSAGVGQRDRDEQPRHAEHMQELRSDLDDRGLVQAEHRQQLPRKEEKEGSHENGDGETEACRDVHRLRSPIRLAGAEVLSGHRRGGAHQADRRPRDERE